MHRVAVAQQRLGEGASCLYAAKRDYPSLASEFRQAMTAFPPVFSAISVRDLASAALAVIDPSRTAEVVSERLSPLYPGRAIWLTSSGTAALALAIQMSRPNPVGKVALPAYACPDVASAALAMGAEIVLYDLDPQSLEPDVASFTRALRLGCTHAVVTHLYGRVVEVSRLQEIAEQAGVVLIEDAAQHAGGGVGGQRAGGLAGWGVLSFGRGKGINAAGGGALIVDERLCSDSLRSKITARLASTSPRGAVVLLKASATQLFSSPHIYAGVRRLPWLEIGETNFAPLNRVEAISAASRALLCAALDAEPLELATRRDRASWYRRVLVDGPAVQFTATREPLRDGALRYPLKWTNRSEGAAFGDVLERSGLAALGVVRSYPRTLLEYGEFRQSIVNGKNIFAGASELAKSLVTLPTHGRITHTIATQIVSRLRAAIKS
jgi:dTDP-4-amino-4,6-dideoxygalactose transaminase